MTDNVPVCAWLNVCPGIDMSPLFSEMIMATATQDLVQKKMCYLYLSNYASLQSEMALLVINTLQKDSRDQDPMVIPMHFS